MEIENKFFLRAESKEALWGLLVEAGIAIPNPEGSDRPYAWAPGFDLDEAGVFSVGGECDPETGEVVTPPTVLEGYHLNGIGVLTEEQTAILAPIRLPEPVNRLRYWAGEQVIVLPPPEVFPDAPAEEPAPEPAPEGAA